MIASSFNRAPGLPVLHSRNLVDWEHVTNALPALVPAEHYSLPRRGSGVWAPSLREHHGTFYITYPDPDHGIFVLDAPHPHTPSEERSCITVRTPSSMLTGPIRMRSGPATTTG